MKQKHLKSLNEKHEEETKNLLSIGFDGKCGMVKEPRCQSTMQDKQSFNNSVTGDYLDHKIPTGGSGQEIFDCFYEILVKYKSTASILNVNMDGCKVNTGKHQGVVRYLETKLQRPLTWTVCLLHGNELVFRHLFEAIGEFFSK